MKGRGFHFPSQFKKASLLIARGKSREEEPEERSTSISDQEHECVSSGHFLLQPWLHWNCSADQASLKPTESAETNHHHPIPSNPQSQLRLTITTHPLLCDHARVSWHRVAKDACLDTSPGQGIKASSVQIPNRSIFILGRKSKSWGKGKKEVLERYCFIKFP